MKKIMFLSVGGFTTLLGFFLIWVLVDLMRWNQTLAWPVQALIVIQVNFVLNKLLTWRERKVGLWQSWWRFMLTRLTGNFLGAWLVYVLLAVVLNHHLANIAVTVIFLVYNYLTSEYFVFKEKSG